jgi:hypothetical protein
MVSDWTRNHRYIANDVGISISEREKVFLGGPMYKAGKTWYNGICQRVEFSAVGNGFKFNIDME